MAVNWWSIAGLISDIVGVAGVGIIPDVWARTTYGAGVRLPRLWQRVLYRVSWALIIAGFVLQLLGQIRVT